MGNVSTLLAILFQLGGELHTIVRSLSKDPQTLLTASFCWFLLILRFSLDRATQTVIVLLALVLLTLRVSFFDLEEVLEDEDTPSVGCCACLCRTKPPPKDEHIGEITVARPSEAAKSKRGSCFGCFGSRQAPKDKHIGEISITKQAAPTPIANQTSVSTPVATLQAIEETPSPTSNKDSYAIEYSSSESSASPASKKDTYEIEYDASDASDSYESGSIEEASLKG